MPSGSHRTAAPAECELEGVITMDALEKSLARLLDHESKEIGASLTPAQWLGPEPARQTPRHEPGSRVASDKLVKLPTQNDDDVSDLTAYLEEKIVAKTRSSTTTTAYDSDYYPEISYGCETPPANSDELTWHWPWNDQQWGSHYSYNQDYRQDGPAVDYQTAMLRNIPNKYTTAMLVKRLYDSGYKGVLDFLYLPTDFKHNCNMGYAFLNFRDCWSCAKFAEEFHLRDSSYMLPGFKSKKVCEVSRAWCQGARENIQRLFASPVMVELAKRPDCMPKLFDEWGAEVDFPLPDHVAERRFRSRWRGRIQDEKFTSASNKRMA